MSTKEASIVYMPYVRFAGRPRVGPWELRPLKRARGWPSKEFGQVARRYLTRHRDVVGKSLTDMTVVSRDGELCYSEDPDPDELRALQAALALAVLSGNPTSTDESWRVVTSDNLDLFQYRLSGSDTYFTSSRGSVVTVTNHAKLFGPRSTIAAPSELHAPETRVLLDDDLASETYGLLVGIPDRERADRLYASIMWLMNFWRNSPALTWATRAVMVRSGIEVLLDRRGAWDQSKVLRARFEDLHSRYPHNAFDELLWSPSEDESRTVIVGGKEQPATPLQHWYRKLSNHRNETLHSATGAEGPVFDADGPYGGPLVWTGEHVLRDLIRAELSVLAGSPLFEGKLYRALWAALEE